MLNSDYARMRILGAAYDLFGKFGYVATTVRMIAHHAHVSLSAIPYYYESKDNLFQQVVQTATQEFVQYFKAIIQEIDAFLARPERSAIEAKTLLLRLADKHLDYVFDPRNVRQLRLFFQLRTSFGMAGTTKMSFNMTTTHLFISLLKEMRPDLADDEATILAFSIIGEQLFFFYHRPSVLNQLGLTEFSAESISRIRKVLIQRLECDLSSNISS